ncbi:F0F1 ATP synthase subunit A [Peterkaempfera bronchialis]|uniref:ATP synthase subunit a n=1 Tax=Peterkaempfera bronchialis TaxID=2126346 RepID=A0A345T0G9_9ACTN|nr:F0F1 ATP synthase subunit A [Peterkaempfera bronchialis]AXI79474.1 ATP synthase F0 subunit A [Peterkaempfera bronchialis]
MSSALTQLASEADCHLNSGCGFPAPGLHTFNFEPLFTVGGVEVIKPMLLSVIAMLAVIGFFWAAFARPKLVPGKLQLVGEIGYDFVKRSIVLDSIGKKGQKYVPMMVSLFFFVWIMNVMSIIPFAQFPVTSKIAFPAGLAAVVWITYMTLTFKKHGFVGGLKNLCWPSGIPGWVMFLLVPIEFFSNIFVRPFTLAVRLFANMFAGHLLIVMFSVASWYLLTPSIGALYAGASFVVTLGLTAFELLIQFLQAYIFVMLASSYISGALEEAH